MARGRHGCRLAGGPPQRRGLRSGRRDVRAHRGARRGRLARGTGERAEGEQLPTARGAAGADPEEAAGEIPTAGHTMYPGPGSADGGHASADADLRSGPATGTVRLQGRPERAGRSAPRASAGEHRSRGNRGRRSVELLRRDPARGVDTVHRAARERRAHAGLDQAVAGDGRGRGRRQGRPAPHEPGAPGKERDAARRSDLPVAEQRLHAAVPPGLEAAGPRPAVRRGDSELRGRLRDLRQGPGASHAGRGRTDHGAAPLAAERDEDPLPADAGGAIRVPRVPHRTQLQSAHGPGLHRHAPEQGERPQHMPQDQ